MKKSAQINNDKLMMINLFTESEGHQLTQPTTTTTEPRPLD